MFRRVTQAIILVSATVSMAQATTLFSGAGTSGTTQGQTWVVNADTGSLYGQDDWGMPGVYLGTETWVNPAANYLTFSFTLPGGVTIDPGIIGTNCANDLPCMLDTTTGDTWAPVLGPGDLSITFYAPGSDFLNPGDSFYLNVWFTSTYSDGLLANGLSFSGAADVTPEPASMALLGAGLVGLAMLRKMAKC